MASNLKVDIVRPTATNGSLSLKGDSGGSVTTNGITVDSSGDTSITGTTTVSSLVATTADINGGTIDNTTIGGVTPAAGSFTQVNADNLRLDGSTISSTNTNGDINITPNGSGNVGIGATSSPDAKLHVATSADNVNFPNWFDYSDATAVFSTGDTGSADGFVKFLSGLYNAASTNNLDLIVRNKNNNYDAGFRITAGSGSGVATNNGYLSFSRIATDGTTINATERLRIDSSGNVRADKFTDLAGTGAPDFPNGLILANNAITGNITGVTLDDYEEGDWTPTGNNITFASAYGTYIKIGNLVFATYSCQWPSTANADDATINSLPFPVKSSGLGSQGARYGVAPGYINKADVNFTVTETPDLISLRDNLGGAYSNADVSSKIFRGVAIYET